MNKAIINATFVLVIVFVTYLPVLAAPENEYDDPTHAQRMLDQLKAMDKPLTFYGRIIDHDGSPVADAAVATQIEDSSGVRDVTITSGADGVFGIINETGNSILIHNITCKGYEYNREEPVKTSFENGSYVPDKNNPFIFPVRKKELATLVLKENLEWMIKPTVDYYEVDLVEREFDKPGCLRENNSRARTDIKIKAVKAAEKNAYIVTFDGKDNNSEIMELSSLLYVPPETGYNKTLSLEVPMGTTITKYIYIKGRNGAIYSRIDTTLRADANGVIITATIFTNPNGLRNLDFDKDLWAQYIKQRFNEDRQQNIDREEKRKKGTRKINLSPFSLMGREAGVGGNCVRS
jgi:hypothetical protein